MCASTAASTTRVVPGAAGREERLVTRATAGLTRSVMLLTLLLILVPAGCDDESDGCPEGVPLSGTDMPCACGDVTWEDIPPTEEGVVCTCDPDAGFGCATED